jgi:citrate synthase
MLAVTRPTLYAYVSRGFIRSEAHAGSSRQRRYSRDDVDRLRRRTDERRDPEKAAAHALQWGMPILESSITLIAGDRLYYRGHDAMELARSRPVSEVASLIWTGRFDFALSPTPLSPAERAVSAPRGARALPFIARAQSTLAIAAARDPVAFDLRPESVALTGWRIVNLLTRTAADARPPLLPIDERLARAWNVKRAGNALVRAALVLCADHELNVSAFTARCIASAGSNPYAVAIGGLAALEGAKHGGMTARVESMLQSMRRERKLRAALADRLRRGETIDGFGHPLYHNGDPRAAALLRLLGEFYPRSPERAFVADLAEAAAAVLRERPTLDFALAAMARVLRLPPGAPLTLFAIGRTIGWIGHAIEQYAAGQIIRPRAKYVGDVPEQPRPGPG